VTSPLFTRRDVYGVLANQRRERDFQMLFLDMAWSWTLNLPLSMNPIKPT